MYVRRNLNLLESAQTAERRLHMLESQITIRRLRRVRCVRAARLVRAVYLKLGIILMTLLREGIV